MKIVICGGGTAGWIAAYFINKSQGHNDQITVVESSKIGIVGAGEGSTGILRDLISGYFFDHTINDKEFMEKTDSTPKLGIKHINWTGDSSEYFAPIDVSPTAFSLNDEIFKYNLFLNKKENIHLCSILGFEYENKKYDGLAAFHFDAFKIGNFFKEICVKDGVKLIDDVIKDVNLNEKEEISSIVLEDNGIVEGDFFIDCTGFSRVLSKKMNIKWKSYSEVLPVNSAMPFLLEYEKDDVFVAETKAVAMSSGWMWDIPLKSRRGCGYVFDQNFISEKEAQKEIEKFLGKPIDPIRFLSFDSGHVEQFWKKNLLVLGLSSSFVEPLEASSIHNTIVQIAIFVKEFLLKTKNDTISEINQKIYNKRITFLNEITIDFISLHYQGGRTDSEFWRSIIKDEKITENTRILLEKSKNKIPGFVMMEGMWGSHSIPLANYILAGMEIITPEQAYRDLVEDHALFYAEKNYKQFSSLFINKNKSYITYTN